MDPTTAIEHFNSPSTCRAERSELASGLLEWLLSGGFRPEGTLDEGIIASLRAHYEPEAALNAIRVNELLTGNIVLDYDTKRTKY